MQPRPAVVTIYHERHEFESMSVDGNTPNFRTVREAEDVPAMVWPVSMGPDEMLVEYEHGRLDRAKLWDIRMVVTDDGTG